MRNLRGLARKESTGTPWKGEERECLLKGNAESTGLPRQGEEGECFLRVNAESTGLARKGEEWACLLKLMQNQRVYPGKVKKGSVSLE
ncbi:hypothetical protein CRG98_014641 [Punica granatum]|uniref:Uncharacterized protein n=1 Tax=Punica granatum TaxID=22663 RepID=A0A2I0K8V9_PUNGR|nr:hypothetical protein CRG98_014641 [Punica granatum]